MIFLRSNPAPEWISTQVWDNITELDLNVEAFKGFQRSLEQTLRDWKKWYATPDPENEPLPGEWDARLDPLQKLVVVRCIRPDRALPAIAVYVSQKLEKKFVEPPPFDLSAVYDESQAETLLLTIK